MGYVQLRELFERQPPARSRLVRKSSDQIHVDVADASCPQRLDIGECLLRRMQAAYRFDLIIDQRLRAQANPIRATSEQRLENVRPQSARRALHRDLRRGTHVELVPNHLEDASQLISSKGGRRTSAEINRI